MKWFNVIAKKFDVSVGLDVDDRNIGYIRAYKGKTLEIRKYEGDVFTLAIDYTYVKGRFNSNQGFTLKELINFIDNLKPTVKT